jgi:hypothetical protein
LKERQIDEYIKKARELIQSNLAETRNYEQSLTIERLNDLYRQAYESKKWLTCLQIEQTRVKLLSLQMEDEDLIAYLQKKGFEISHEAFNGQWIEELRSLGYVITHPLMGKPDFQLTTLDEIHAALCELDRT